MSFRETTAGNDVQEAISKNQNRNSPKFVFLLSGSRYWQAVVYYCCLKSRKIRWTACCPYAAPTMTALIGAGTRYRLGRCPAGGPVPWGDRKAWEECFAALRGAKNWK